VDVDEMIASAMHQAQFSAETREIELVRGPLINASVDGDKKQLVMAIHNLLENAINYSSNKTKVTINTSVVNGILEISVIDQGIGIEDKDTERIFERFYRVDPARSRETGGTGLGLSIVKHVALNHGGTVSVWSSLGVGSTFNIKLPVRENANKIEEAK
jgi:two-component system sensor histidine kinase SenX3